MALLLSLFHQEAVCDEEVTSPTLEMQWCLLLKSLPVALNYHAVAGISHLNGCPEGGGEGDTCAP